MGLFDKLKRVFASDNKEEAARRADAGIEGFWSVWSTHAPQIAAEVGQKMSPDLIETVAAAVSGIHPELDWEFGPGANAAHGFTVSGHGDAGLRLLAERWRRAAPPSDDFDFFATRQPVPKEEVMGMSLGFAGEKLAFSEVRVAVERHDSHRVIDVRIHHPSFARLEEQGRLQASFLILDDALGEDGVERWIGALDLLETPPEDGVDLLGVLDAVAEVMALPEDTWCLGDSEQRGQPVVHVVNRAAKRWDYPLFDSWCGIRLDYDANQGGMPNPSDKAALDTLEEGLMTFVGEAGLNLGRRTGAGYREIYLYVDGSTDTAERLLAWCQGCGWPARLSVGEDPQWSRRP